MLRTCSTWQMQGRCKYESKKSWDTGLLLFVDSWSPKGSCVEAASSGCCVQLSRGDWISRAQTSSMGKAWPSSYWMGYYGVDLAVGGHWRHAFEGCIPLGPFLSVYLCHYWVWTLSTHVKKAEFGAVIQEPNAGRWILGTHWPASLANQWVAGSVRNLISKCKV